MAEAFRRLLIFYCLNGWEQDLTPFFKKLLPFIKKHQLRYYIDAAGTEEEELVSGIEKNDLEKLKASR